MRKTLQRRPGFEALESMTLLSGLAGAAASIGAPHPIQLTGSIKIEVKFHHPQPTDMGAGSISPLGHVTESGGDSMSLIMGDGESITLTTKTGKIFVTISGLTDTGNGNDGEYTITGGTKAYAGETGSGHVHITYPRQGKFTESYS